MLFSDRGYVSKELFQRLLDKGIKLVTGIKKNMKNQLMPPWEKLVLRKRGIVETINDQLKNISQIEHNRHRSPINFIVNLLAGLTAYQLRSIKPQLKLTKKKERLLAGVKLNPAKNIPYLAALRNYVNSIIRLILIENNALTGNSTRFNSYFSF
ncbi:transposase [Candidatus Saccharibacteria bacterium]|nr:transposase [Candidatus Saccharibacteria bacterium]